MYLLFRIRSSVYSKFRMVEWNDVNVTHHFHHSQVLIVLVPIDIEADGIPRHLSILGIVYTHDVEEFPPYQLRHEGFRKGHSRLGFLEGFFEFVEEQSNGNRSESKMRRKRT